MFKHQWDSSILAIIDNIKTPSIPDNGTTLVKQLDLCDATNPVKTIAKDLLTW